MWCVVGAVLVSNVHTHHDSLLLGWIAAGGFDHQPLGYEPCALPIAPRSDLPSARHNSHTLNLG